MKKYILALVTVVLLLTIMPILAFAHSGKTDSNGGHTDHSTGEYHYHHGYPAHQHPGGKCPYNSDNKTNSSTSSSNGSSGYNNSYASSSSNSNTNWLIIVIGAASVTLICAGVIIGSREIVDKLHETVGKILFGVWIAAIFVAIVCFVNATGIMILIIVIEIFVSVMINNVIEDRIRKKKEKTANDEEDMYNEEESRR